MKIANTETDERLVLRNYTVDGLTVLTFYNEKDASEVDEAVIRKLFGYDDVKVFNVTTDAKKHVPDDAKWALRELIEKLAKTLETIVMFGGYRTSAIRWDVKLAGTNYTISSANEPSERGPLVWRQQ